METKVILFDNSGSDRRYDDHVNEFNFYDCTLNDLLLFLEGKKKAVPEEYKKDIQICFSAVSCYDSALLEVEIYYNRPETVEEIVARETKEKEYISMERERRKQEYNKLLKEFGNERRNG